MKDHYQYLKYVVRHKYYVFKASQLVGLNPIRAVLHDWTKFLPREWFPYVKTFYAPSGQKHYIESDAFSLAWNGHQKRNKHHWQWWVLIWDRGDSLPLPMDFESVKEMICDWLAAGLAINGKVEVFDWYEKNKHKMILNDRTRSDVESLLAELKEKL
jgi:hypothetical protein